MKAILLSSLLLGSLFAKAGELSKEYIMFCGSKSALVELAKQEGQKVTKKDLVELAQSRSPILNVLQKGAAGIQELLDEGSKNDTGAFGVMAVCTVINDHKDEIKANGCIDLNDNSVVEDNGGIDSCAKVMDKLSGR